MMIANIRSVGRRSWWLSVATAGVIGLTACSASAQPAATIATTASPAAQETAATMPPTSARAPTGISTQTQTAPTEPLAAATMVLGNLPPTPACANLKITPAQTEGPYYKPNTPERSSLIASDVSGAKLIVAGYVLTTDCKPIAGAWLDFWQADAEGQYDNAGYNLRGHQTTDASGRYYLETVMPGLYPGRTRHIHVKVQAPNGPVLTTQLYFPNEPGNTQDSIFDPALIVALQNTASGEEATFNFVLKMP